MNHVNVLSINIFSFTKDDVTKKKKTVPTDFVEVKGTAKCHEVSICHDNGIKLMKNTSDQPGKHFVFSMKDTTRGKRGKIQVNGNNKDEIETDYEEEEEDELMEEEEITERDEEEDEDHQDRYEQDEAKEANEEEKPVGNEDQHLEKPEIFTIGDYVQVMKGKYCGMYATVLCVVDNREVQIQYFEKRKQQMVGFEAW